MHKHYPSPFVMCIGTMKHLFTIFPFIFLCLGIIALSQEEQPGSQIPAESPEGSTARYAASECSFNSSSDCTLPDNSHSLFNNGTDSYGFNNALCPANPYTHYNVSTKSLKTRLHLPAGQLQHLLASHLSANQTIHFYFTPNAIRYSCGYFIYALARILI